MQEILQKKMAKIREGNSLGDTVVTLGTVTKVIDPRIGPKPVIKTSDGSVYNSFNAAALDLARNAGYSEIQIRSWGVWTDKLKGSW